MVAGEQVPLLIPAQICEALFAHCTGKEAARLLRRTYNSFDMRGTIGHCLQDQDFIRQQRCDGMLKIREALRGAAYALQTRGLNEGHSEAQDVEEQDREVSISKRRVMQEDHVIVLQHRKIKELESRAAHLKQFSHCFIQGVATATDGELKEAQARRHMLKLYTEQQAAEILKLQERTQQAEQQRQDRSKMNSWIKSLWESSKLVGENARLVSQNRHVLRQIDVKVQHLTELTFHVDQLKEMYECNEKLVLDEGAALSCILIQKETEVARLKSRIAKVQEEIKVTIPKTQDTEDGESLRYHNLQARGRFSQAVMHANQLGQQFDALQEEIRRKTQDYHSKQTHLMDVRHDVTAMTGTVQDWATQESVLDFTDISLLSYKRLKAEGNRQARASPYVSRQTIGTVTTILADHNLVETKLLSDSVDDAGSGERKRPCFSETDIRVGGAVVASHNYYQVHDDELTLVAGDHLTIISASEDQQWYVSRSFSANLRLILSAM